VNTMIDRRDVAASLRHSLELTRWSKALVRRAKALYQKLREARLLAVELQARARRRREG
jgi:hypothetical protein